MKTNMLWRQIGILLSFPFRFDLFPYFLSMALAHPHASKHAARERTRPLQSFSIQKN